MGSAGDGSWPFGDPSNWPPYDPSTTQCHLDNTAIIDSQHNMYNNGYTNQNQPYPYLQQQQGQYHNQSANPYQLSTAPVYMNVGPRTAFNNNVPQYNNNNNIAPLPHNVRDHLQRSFDHAAPGLQFSPEQYQAQQAIAHQNANKHAAQNTNNNAANRPSLTQRSLELGVGIDIQHRGNFRPHPESHDSTQNISATTPTKAQAVPIPRLPSQTSAVSVVQKAENKTTTPAMGPMSKQVDVPPRPKPGRKPMPDLMNTDRRRKQNRDAQRNFRDKRATKVTDMQKEMDNLRTENQELVADHERKMEDRRKEIERLTAEVARAEKELRDALDRARVAEIRAHHADVEGRFRAGGMSNATVVSTGTAQPIWNGNIMDSDPMDSGDMEIDFTNLASTNFNRERCGFCTDDDNCACKAQQNQPRKVAPGSCDACQLDPARAAACRDLADQTMGDSKGDDSIRNDSLVTPQGSERLMSCSTMIDRMGHGSGQRIPSIAELFPGTLRVYGAENGMGYNVNEQEAAQVLQSMSRRNTAVSPRQQ